MSFFFLFPCCCTNSALILYWWFSDLNPHPHCVGDNVVQQHQYEACQQIYSTELVPSISHPHISPKMYHNVIFPCSTTSFWSLKKKIPYKNSVCTSCPKNATRVLVSPQPDVCCLMVKIFRLMLAFFYIYSTNIPPIMIINRICETQNLLSCSLFSSWSS